MPPSTVIIVTARNEADRLAATIAGLRDGFADATIVVVDDASSDGTADVAADVGAVVVATGAQLGKGGAATLGARRALALAGPETIFVLCDGDLGASARRLASLDGVVRDAADVAVAVFARRIGGGFGVAAAFAGWAIRRRCDLRLTAPISGQRALTRKALETTLPFAGGFGMEIGMTIDAARAGLRVSEVELDIEHRATGRDLSGFVHRAGQLRDFVTVYREKR